MSYQQVAIAPRHGMGAWTAAQTKAYWDARAQRCRQYADEGACLARVSRHVPVTIESGYSGLAGLGQTAAQTTADVASFVAGLISNPNATIQRTSPAIVTALDTYVVGPVTDRAVQRATPYIVAYFGPPVVAMYVMVALSTWFSYQVFVGARDAGRIKSNRRRRRLR